MAKTSQNPFTFNYWSGTGGPDVEVAPTFGDLQRASLWDWQEARRKGSITSPSGSAWSPAGQGASSRSGPRTAADYGIETIDLNPVGADAVRAAIGKAGQLIGSDGTPLLSTQVRSPESQNLLNAGTTRWQAGVNQTGKRQAALGQSLSDFTASYMAGSPKQEQLTAEESAAISPVFTGGYEASLRKPLNAFNLASNEEYQRALAQIGRGVKDQALLGQGEYGLARAYDATKDLAIARAKERAAMESAIPGQVLQAQMAALGRRTAADEALRRRALLPYDLENQLLMQDAALRGQDISQLGAIQNQYLANLYQEPYEAQLARQGELIGQLGRNIPLFSMLGSNVDIPYVPYPRRSSLLPAPTPSSYDYPDIGPGLLMDASTGEVLPNFFPKTSSSDEMAKAGYSGGPVSPMGGAALMQSLQPRTYTPNYGTGWGLGGYYENGQLNPDYFDESMMYPLS